MRYKLLLTGGKEVIINQGSKEEIQNILMRKIDTFVSVEGELVKSGAIKAILKHDDQGIDPMTQKRMMQENNEWNLECLKKSQRSSEDKTEREMKYRILPGWRMAKLFENDPVLSDIYVKIQDFFDKNPNYPNCPVKVWWSLVADKIAPEETIKIGQTVIKKRSNPDVYLGKWFTYLLRNDEAVEAWVNYRNGGANK